MCAALENVSDSKDINRTWKNIKESIKTSATESLDHHELKQHKQWFEEECLGFLDKSRPKCNEYRIQTKEL
jgi:hypothetical protein